MRMSRVLAAATAAALTLAPAVAVSASAKTAPVKPKPRFVVSSLGIIGHTRTYDVTTTSATIRFRVQVKDFDKKFDPKSVSVVVVEKVSGSPATSFTVKTRLTGRSKVVSTWRGSIVVPKGSAAATYCLSVVKVDPSSTPASPVKALARGLVGRDCFTVVDKAPSAS